MESHLPTWNDTQRDNEVTSSEIAYGHLRITVHRHASRVEALQSAETLSPVIVHFDPEEWLVTCLALGVNACVLGKGMSLDVAQRFALDGLDARLFEMHHDLSFLRKAAP